jgi:speckle-type POZ protein
MSSSALFRGRAQSTSSIVASAVEGSHVLTIDGYSRTKGLGNGKLVESDRFDVGGHRWFIKYYPDGYNSENADWMSIFLTSDRSDNMEVKARFGFSLLDHAGELVPSYARVGNVIRVFGPSSRSWGYQKFIKRKDFEESTYLKDCFRVRCDVTVSKEMEIRKGNNSQFVTVSPSDINQHLGNLLSSGVEADVTFQVGEETFAAHRLVLGARSSIFMAELFGPMKDKHTSYINIIDDMEPRVFKAMLHYIYTDSLPEIEKHDVFVMSQHLLVAADRYGLERLKLICEDKLCNYISAGTAATSLALAEQHGCKWLKEACFSFLKTPSNLKAAMANEGFDHLMSSCPSVVKELLAKVACCP